MESEGENYQVEADQEEVLLKIWELLMVEEGRRERCEGFLCRMVGLKCERAENGVTSPTIKWG